MVFFNYDLPIFSSCDTRRGDADFFRIAYLIAVVEINRSAMASAHPGCMQLSVVLNLCDLFSIHTSLGAVGSQDIDMHCKQYRRLVVDRYVFIFAAFGRDGESLDFS